MSGLTIEIPGTLATPRIGKAGPLEFIHNADGTSPLFAGYLHGTDAHLGAPSEGAPFTDLSGNGHTLTQTGANNTNVGQVATGFMGTGQTYLNTPFTQTALVESGVDEEFTILHFAFHPSTDGTLYGTRVTGAAGYRHDQIANSTYNSTNLIWNDATFTQGVFENPIPAWRATEPFMFGLAACAATGSMQMMRGRDGEVLFNGKTLASGITTLKAATTHRIGQRSVNTPNNTVSYATLFFDRVLTPAEVRTVYAGMRRLLLARVSVDV